MPLQIPEHEDDASLALRMMDRDLSALLIVMERYASLLRGHLRMLFHKVLSHIDIDAAVNFASFKLWRTIEQYDTKEGTLGSWYMRIAENSAIDMLRQVKRNPTIESPESPVYDKPEFDCIKGDDWEADPISSWRANELNRIINEELEGNMQAVALADLLVGGNADRTALAQKLGTTVTSISSTRTNYRNKIERLMLEREAKLPKSKGNRK